MATLGNCLVRVNWGKGKGGNWAGCQPAHFWSVPRIIPLFVTCPPKLVDNLNCGESLASLDFRLLRVLGLPSY